MLYFLLANPLLTLLPFCCVLPIVGSACGSCISHIHMHTHIHVLPHNTHAHSQLDTFFCYLNFRFRLPACLTVCLPGNYAPLSLPVCLCVCLSVRLSARLSARLSVCPFCLHCLLIYLCIAYNLKHNFVCLALCAALSPHASHIACNSISPERESSQFSTKPNLTLPSLLCFLSSIKVYLFDS